MLTTLLLVIDKVSSSVIVKDFEGDERLFGKLIALYNEDQTLSKDAFSLRDLSLQCAVSMLASLETTVNSLLTASR